MSSFPSTARVFSPIPLAVALAFGFAASSALAAPFTISGASSTVQTLGAAQGELGTVTASGVLTITGGTTAVTITGNNETLNNLGTINQTGTGRAIRDNAASSAAVSNLTITNGSTTNSTALMQANDADVIQMQRAGDSVTFNNYGRLISNNVSNGGAQAIDFASITTGANAFNNYAGGLVQATEADAVRMGVNGVLHNAGTIQSFRRPVVSPPSGTDGVDMQNNTGAQITNDLSGVIDGARHGITGGALNSTVSFTMTVNNGASATIRGSDGSGINIDGFNALERVTVNNAGLIVGNGITGDGDGVDVDGLVTINNSGIIRSTNAFSPVAQGLAFSEGISVGGGSITNSGTIEGLVSAGNTNAVGRGITLVGNDITTGPLAGTREAIYGNTTVTNNAGGLIRGQNDSAIVVGGPASGFTVSITNNANATIRGGGATTAAIVTGFDNDTITNGGTIDGASSNLAIDMGAGNNRLNIVGGQAVVLGNVNGGAGGTNTLSFNLGAGNQFTYAGAFSNFATVSVDSGRTTLSGVNTYTGTTKIGVAATLVLDGAQRLAAASALDLAGGTLVLENANGPDGQTFARLDLDADSFIDLDGSSITFAALGAVVNDALLAVTGFVGGPDDYALRFLGDLRGNASFLELIGNTTIDGRSAFYRFDGTFTDLVIPEPPSIALMFAGLAIVVGFARRRTGGVARMA